MAVGKFFFLGSFLGSSISLRSVVAHHISELNSYICVLLPPQFFNSHALWFFSWFALSILYASLAPFIAL